MTKPSELKQIEDIDPKEFHEFCEKFNRGYATEHQTNPKPNRNPAVWGLVINDMVQRDHLGRERYGTPLQPFNGRDSLVDAYQEALDLAVYLRTAIYERDGK